MKLPYFAFLFLLLFACKNETESAAKFDENFELTDQQIPEIDFETDEKSEGLLKKFDEQFGIMKRETGEIKFQKANENYLIKRNCGWFEIEKILKKEGKEEVLVLDNSGIIKKINGKEQNLNPAQTLKEMKNLKEALFFMEFPFGLNSQTVQKRFVAEEKFEDRTLNIIEFAFVEDQVIKPYLVQGMMWVDQSTGLPEFLAVDFDGHAEFRKIIDHQEKEGVYFFDYEIYQADKPVDDLHKWMTFFQDEVLKKTGEQIYKNIEVKVGSSSCD